MRFQGRRGQRAKRYLILAGLLMLAVPTVWLVSGYARSIGGNEALATGPEGVAAAWVDALGRQDVAGALDLLHDESFLILMSTGGDNESESTSDSTGSDELGDGAEIITYEGKEEIRAELQRYQTDNVRVQLLQPPELVQGTVVWAERRSADSLRLNGISSMEFTGEALVEGGKIRSLIYTPIYTPAREEPPGLEP